MTRFLLLLAVCCPMLAQNSRPEPQWTVNLHESNGFQSFERATHLLWLRQQGVTFIAPDRIVVYQVNERRSPTPLGRRDVNGGAGNFFLDLKILNTHDGHEIQSMRMPTNGVFSQVVAGRSGNFIVRTGDILYLVSPELKVLATKPLTLTREAPFEAWHIDRAPSEALIALVHQQTFIHPVVLLDGTVASPGKCKVDVEIVDANTLQTVKQFRISNYLLHWSAGDHYLVGTHPSEPYHAEEFGIVDFDGRWKNLKAIFESYVNCPFIMEALDHDLVAAYNCLQFAVLSESGHRIFSIRVASEDMPVSVVSSGDYMAVEFAVRPKQPNFSAAKLNPVMNLKPLRIDLFNLQSGDPLLSIPLEKTVVYCDVSREGLVAVLEGEMLKMYAVGK